MRGRSGAAGCKIELAWVGLRMNDELGDSLGRKRWIHDHDERSAHSARDRSYVTDEIEVELVEEHGVDDHYPADRQKCVPVGGRAHHRLSPEVVATARPVLNDELLTEPLRKPSSDHAHDNIVG